MYRGLNQKSPLWRILCQLRILLEEKNKLHHNLHPFTPHTQSNIFVQSEYNNT